MFRRRPRFASRMQGAALIVLMALLAMGVLYFLTVQLAAISGYEKESRGASDSLAQAREALLGYAATYRDTHPGEVVGYLLCPDTTGDGIADPPCGLAGEASVGLLPYHTLELPDLRDSAGVCLWYAVAGTFKNNPMTTATAMNWDTQGQFTVLDSGGATLVAPEDAQGGAAAVIFATGLPLAGQSRTAASAGPCQIDPTQVAAYLDSAYSFATSGTVTLTQGPVKDAYGGITNNDRMAWVSPREIFDRIVTRKDFSNALAGTPPGQINTLTNEIKAAWEKNIQDDLVAGTTSTSQPANTASFTQPAGKQVGTLPSSLTLNDGNYTNYYDNWSGQYRQALCSSLATPCLSVAGTSCRGALMFGGRSASGQPRTAAQQDISTANLDHYFEAGSGREILNSTATTFTGLSAYTEIGTAAGRALDVGTCLFPGEFKSFAQDIAGFAAGVTSSAATPTASVDTAAKTVTLANSGGAASSGCAWYATPIALGTTLRLYFRLQFATKGDGFTLALADGATNLAPNSLARTQIMCGAADSASLGYAGPPPSGSAAGIQKPKLGIEFDTFYSASRNDPPGDRIHSQSAGDHMAFLYWGTSADSDGSDDNAHYLGSGGVAVTNATWASGTATLTTASPHGFASGDVVLVSGLAPSGYNGTITVSSPTTTQFSYALTGSPGAYVSPGQAKAVSTGSAPRNPRVATAMRNAPVNVFFASYSTATQRARLVTSTPHGLTASAGNQVLVSGVSRPEYNGTFKVISVIDSTTFEFAYASASAISFGFGGNTNRVAGTELSALAWAGATATAASPAAHGLLNGQNITTFGMTPGGYGSTANLAYVDATHFTFPLATDPGGSFSTETPAGMAMVKTADSHLPYSRFPTATNIHVRLDLNRRYDTTNHVAVLDMKAYIGSSFPLADACAATDLQNLSRDVSALCPSRAPTLQQDSVPINALAAMTGATWSSGTVTVTTAAAHGLVSGSTVTISGASPITYNGTFSITVTGATTFTYAAVADPGSYVSGGDVEPLSTFYLGFTNSRGSANAGENQSITIRDLLLRSQ